MEQKKKDVHSREGRFYHEREIWWCSLGVNVGHEQDGHGLLFQRPVLVVKGLSANTCIVIPLTASGEGHPMRISLGKIDGKEAFAIISQLRVVDTRRFTERLHILDKKVFKNMQKTIRKLF